MNFAVKVTPEISEALQKIAFKAGYAWGSDRERYVQRINDKYIHFIPHEMRIRANKDTFNKFGATTGYQYELVTIEKAIELLSEERIVIGGYTVQFKDKAIQVGCQTVSLETVEKIYKKLKGL